MTVSSHTSKVGVAGSVQTGSVDVTDTNAVQSTVLTITLANGIVLTATEGTVATDTDVTAMTYVASTGSSTGSKRNAAAASLAGALNANGRLTATNVAATSVVTITEVYGGSGGSLSHAGGGMSVVDWSGGSGSPNADNDGGVVFHGGTIAGGRMTNKSVLAMQAGSDVYGSQLAVTVGDAYNIGLAVARTAGSPVFAFFPKRSERTAANCTFLARGVQTKIAGITSSEGIMGVLGSNHAGRGINYHSEDQYSKGTWANLAFNLFRNPTAGSSDNHGLQQSDGTDKAGAIAGTGQTIFRNLADGDNLKPVANIPSRLIPGELVFLVNFADRSVTGGNFKDYSAITGG